MGPRAQRTPLSRDRVMQAAVDLADRGGLAALSMRALAAEVGVEAMSLYHHVAGKDAVLDGMVDLVFAEIYRPREGRNWAGELRARAHSARAVLTRHPWALGLVDSRSSPGLETLRHHDAVLGCLRAGGFSVPLAAHAFAVLDAHLYGFLLQELSLPFATGEDVQALAGRIFGDLPPDALPHMVELAREHILTPGYRFGDEFDYGLDLILDGLQRRLAAE